MFCAGLTGGIGSGKSTVAQFFVQAGAGLIDADAISRDLTAKNGAAIARIALNLGAHWIDDQGALNRAKVREIVFQDPSAKQKLESILHPLIGQKIAEKKADFENQGISLCIFDIPLLVEGGARWREQLDAVWVVDCSELTQIERVKTRNGWQQSQIEAVIAQQASRAQRLAAADAVFCNEGLSLAQLQQKVQSFCAQFGL